MAKGGYIYLISESGDNELFKIGVTRGSVENRLRKLQTGNGNKLYCVDTYYTDRPYKMEKMLHNHFASEREEGEWFLLNKQQVASFKSLCEGFQTIIDSLKDNPFF